MKKTVFTFLLIFTCTGIFTTNGIARQQWLGRSAYGKPFIGLEGFYAPFFVGRNLSTMSLEKSFTEKFTHEYSYSTGLNFGLYLNKNLAIQTGGWYSARNYLTEIEGTFSGGLGKVSSRYMLNYVSIPLNFKLVMREKVAPFFRLGAVADILTGFSTQSNFFGSATFDDMALMTKTQEQFEKTRYSLLVSFGITGGNLRKNSFYFQLEPMFMYSLSNDSEVLSSSYKPFYYGLTVTLGYNFTKRERESDYEMPEELEYEE